MDRQQKWMVYQYHDNTGHNHSLFLFAESGGQVVKRTSNRIGWFISIIMITILSIITLVFLLAESGDQEAGNLKALGKISNCPTL